MTQTKRYYPRFAGKDGFEERYEVIDSVSREAIGGRVSYHDANERARKLNDEPEAQGEWAVAYGMEQWTEDEMRLARMIPFNPARPPYWIQQRSHDWLYDVLIRPGGEVVARAVPLSEAVRIASG